MDNRYRTYQTRIGIPVSTDEVLTQYAYLYNRVERLLFARLQAGDNIANLKKEFIQRFGITARQFNAMSFEIKGKIQSIKERRSGLIKELGCRISKLKKAIKATANSAVYHQRKRRLYRMQERLNKIKADHKAGKVRLCFGSKRLFRSQFYLLENGYISHDEWLSDWRASRSNQFFVIGSKDETAGCQSCVAAVAQDGSITLRLRLPSALAKNGKYLILNNIRFEYGHKAVVAAIGRNLSDNKSDWQAINYRFLRDDKGWRVFVSVALPETPVRSYKNTGVIGIDINADSLAVTETDRYGNPVEFFIVPCVTYGKNSGQRKAIIGDVVKQVIAFAVNKKKPIIIERLDFQKKKAALEKQSPRYTRMLSSLAYTQIQAIIRARAYDAGIEVFDVNPAYTSVIGQYKFKDRYGMSRHNASALVIGRRFMGLGERLPGQLHVTLPLPVRNRSRHVWSKWAVVSRKTSAAPAAHRRSRKGSSPSPVFDKARLVTNPPVGGEIPPCESSLISFE